MKKIFQPRVLYQSAIDNLSFISLCVIVLSAYPNYILSSLITTLIDDLGFSFIAAATIVNAQKLCAGIFGILGAIIIDAYLTLYGMIFFSSLICSAGFGLLTFGSYHQQNLSYSDTIVIVTWLVGLGVIAIGKFSLVNAAIALSEKGNRRKTPMHQVIESLVDVVILVIFFVHDFPFSGSLFLVSTILMFLVAVVSCFYFKTKLFVKPTGDRRNPFKYFSRVAHSIGTQVTNTLEEGNPKTSLEHTNGKRSPDENASNRTTEPEEQINKWLFFWMCMSFVAYGMVKSIGDTFFLDQGNQMDTTIGNKEIPLQAFLILSELVSIIAKVVYKVWIPKNFRGLRKKYAPGVEYGVGMVLSILCCVCASWVAMEVFEFGEESLSISVFALTPQFVIFGAMNRLTRDGMEGFFRGQLPPLMMNYDVVFTDGIVGAGSFFAIVLVLVTKAADNWFRLDRFYHLCTVVAIAIFLVHITVVVRYPYRDNDGSQLADGSQEQEGNEDITGNANEMMQGTQQEKVDEQVAEDDSIQQNQLEEEGEEQEQNEEPQIIIQPSNLTQDKHLERRLNRQKSMHINVSS